MADINNVFTDNVSQAFCELRSSVDAIVCASDMIPEDCESENIGHLFRLLSRQVDANLTAFFYSFKSSSC